jgi:hypothetical protein
MMLRGLGRDVQRLANLGVGKSTAHQVQHVCFAAVKGVPSAGDDGRRGRSESPS